MKMLGVRILFCCLFAVSCASAAQEPDKSDVPDKADVIKFLDIMHARAQMTQTLNEMARQMKLGAEDGFKQKVPNATPQQLAKVDKVFDTIFSSLPIDEMMDAIVPIYQKHLTKSDLTAITAFYSSPPGQKILKELPAIMSEAMQVGGDIGRKAFAAKSREFDERLADMVKDSSEQ